MEEMTYKNSNTLFLLSLHGATNFFKIVAFITRKTGNFYYNTSMDAFFLYFVNKYGRLLQTKFLP